MLRHGRAIANIPFCFRCCVVLRMASFYDCAASLRFTHMNLRAMSMLQVMPESKVKTIYIVENVRGPSLASTTLYVPWSDDLYEKCVALHNCFLLHAFMT